MHSEDDLIIPIFQGEKVELHLFVKSIFFEYNFIKENKIFLKSCIEQSQRMESPITSRFTAYPVTTFVVIITFIRFKTYQP
jgi:hypothetical protein